MQLRGGAGGGRAGRSAPRGARRDFFGEIGLLVTGRRTASVVSLSMRLIAMFESSFRRLERELPVCADAVRAAAVARFPVVYGRSRAFPAAARRLSAGACLR